MSAFEDRLIHFLLLGGLPVHDQPGVLTPSIFSPGFPAGWGCVVGMLVYGWCEL